MTSPQLVFPDYKNSIVNLMASVEASFGSRPPHTPLAGLDPASIRDRPVVMVLVLDGLGESLLEQHRPTFLFAQPRQVVTSVYPSTTAAAITSLMSGLTPLEHGAMGWTLFFKEMGRYIDFLPFRDSVDRTLQDRSVMDGLLRVSNLFTRIADRGADTWYVGPRYVVRDQFADESSLPARRLGFGRLETMERRLVRAAGDRRGRDGRKFVLGYVTEPDHTIHHRGNAHQDTVDILRRLDRMVEKVARKLAGSGATILVTADHGLIDTPVTHWLDENPEVYRSLVLAPFPERRFLTFHVKAHRRDEFLSGMKRYATDFRLMSRADFLARGVLGVGTPHAKIDDFLGDWVALAVGTAQMGTRMKHPGRKEKTFVAHHAGLLPEEMNVPVIRIDT